MKKLLIALLALIAIALPTAAGAAPLPSSGQVTAYSTLATVQAKATTVTITKYPGAVGRNRYASISVKTAASASCTLNVYYKSGPSKAAGVGFKKASTAGYASWTWKVGGNTTKGTWPVAVTCNGVTARTSLRVP